MERKFFKTTYIVEVLTEDEPMFSGCSLANIEQEMTEGGASGSWTCTKTEELDENQCAKELIAQGSDPEFFQIYDYED